MYYPGKSLARKVFKAIVYGFAIYGLMSSGLCSETLDAKEKLGYVKPANTIVQKQEIIQKSALEKMVGNYEFKQYQRD